MNRRLDELRARAEALIGAAESASLEHELRVQHAELEMQNDELRATQLALQQAKDLYTNLFAAAPVGYLSTDPGAKIVAANHEAGRMLGIGHDRLVGKRFDAFVSAPDLPGFRRRLDGAKPGVIVALDLRLETAGGPLPVRMRAAVSSDRWLVALADRLDVERAELARREAVTEYESERERTEELRRDFVQRLLRAQDEERRHIALELHDGVGQTLAALEIALARLVAAESPALQRSLMQELLSTVHAAVREVKEVSRGLHPSVLDDQGLEPALQRLVLDQRARTGLAIELSCAKLGDLPRELALAAYRVVQEALGNAARHAEPDGIRVTVERSREALQVTIDDDGHGFSPGNRIRAGLGLRGMRERVERHGGTFSVESHPGDGTTVRAHFPLEQTE